jgi:hypothetical protein
MNLSPVTQCPPVIKQKYDKCLFLRELFCTFAPEMGNAQDKQDRLSATDWKAFPQGYSLISARVLCAHSAATTWKPTI